jgi:DNA-binding PadR family transcriptional regulator
LETACFVAPIFVGAPRKDSRNLSAHLSRLEEARYVRIEKEFVQKKPHTMVRLAEEGRKAFELYRSQMQEMFLKAQENKSGTSSVPDQRLNYFSNISKLKFGVFGAKHLY